MSYEDYYSPSTQSYSAPKVNGQLDFGVQKVKKVSNSPFELFTAPLDYYYDSVSYSGDQLPWGVAAVWANGQNKGTVDWTATSDETSPTYALAYGKWYDNLTSDTKKSWITADGEYEGIDKGVSKWLLSNPLATKKAGYLGDENNNGKIDGDINGNGVKDGTEGDFLKTKTVKVEGKDTEVLDGYVIKDTKEGATPYVDAFAIVIDSGVAKLDDFNIGTVSEELSMSFVDTDYDSFLFDETNSAGLNNAFVDVVGHGTHVAGTIAAKADGKGVVGVAPGAEVISLKVFGDTGSTSYDTIMNAVSTAIDYVLEDSTTITGNSYKIGSKDSSKLNTNNTVINLSLGGGTYGPLDDMIKEAAAKGVKFAIAAGNNNGDADFISPAGAGDAENVYTVSAVDKKYIMAPFTNWDDDSDGGSQDDVDVAGPGVDVLSYTDANGTLQKWSGTSMAAPAIAGALLMTPNIDKAGNSTFDANMDQVLDSKDLPEFWTKTTLANYINVGLQDGDDVFAGSNNFTDPFGLSTLYAGDWTDANTGDGSNPNDPNDDKNKVDTTPGDGDDTDGDDKDNNEYNNESPWNGYDALSYYYETIGNIKGDEGNYSMSTGPSSAKQADLEQALSIDSGLLDKSMKFYDETESQNFFGNYTKGKTKTSINATEGSGVKFTGYAQAGDTLVFDYIIASNDYIPYNDFGFVQLKTGTALDGTDKVKSSLQSIGSIGFDVDNFGSKNGTFSYTLTAADFANSNQTVLTKFSPMIAVDQNGDNVINASDEALDLYTADNKSGTNDPFISDKDKVLDLDGDGVITIADALVDTNKDGKLDDKDATSNKFTQATKATDHLDEANNTGKKAIFVKATDTDVLNILGGGTQGINKTTKKLEDKSDANNALDITKFNFAFADQTADLYIETTKAGKKVYEGAADFSMITEFSNQFGDYFLDVNNDGKIDANDAAYDINADGKLDEKDLIDLGKEKGVDASKIAFATNGAITAGVTGLADTGNDGLYNDVDTAKAKILGSGALTTDVKSGEYGFLTKDVIDTYNATKDLADSKKISVDNLISLKESDLEAPFGYTSSGNSVKPINVKQGLVQIAGTNASNPDKLVQWDETKLFENTESNLYTVEVGKVKGVAGTEIYQGYFDLSVGITDAIDTWVDSSLLIKGLEVVGKDTESTPVEDDTDSKYVEGELNWSDEGLMGNSANTGSSSDVVMKMTTGFGAVSQSQIEAVMGFTQKDVLDTDLNKTKAAINATSGSATYATTFAAIGDVIAFDYSFSTSDYSPYKDFSWYSVNNKVQKIVALGEDVQDFGKAKGTILYTLTENDFDKGSYIDPFKGTLDAFKSGANKDYNGDGTIDAKDLDGGGNVVLGFGVMDALDTCVDSNLEISNVYVYGSEAEKPVGEKEKTVDDLDQEFYDFDVNFYGNVLNTVESKYGALNGVLIDTVDAYNFDKSTDVKEDGKADVPVIDDLDQVLDVDNDGFISTKDLIFDVNADGKANYLDLIIDQNSDGKITTADKVNLGTTDKPNNQFITAFKANGELVEDDTFFESDGKTKKAVGFLNESTLFTTTDKKSQTSFLYGNSYGDNKYIYGQNIYSLSVGDYILATKDGDVYKNADGTKTPDSNVDFKNADVIGTLIDTIVDDKGATYFNNGYVETVDESAIDVAAIKLSTKYNAGKKANEGQYEIPPTNTLDASAIEFYTGLESGKLSTNLSGTKNSIDATTGSAVAVSGVGAVGDTFSFDFIFDSKDYNPYQDFAYVSINGNAQVLVDLNTGKKAAVNNSSGNIGSSNIGEVKKDTNTNGIQDSGDIFNYDGYFEYTLKKSDFGGENFGDFTLSVGVMNAQDNAVTTDLYMTNMDYVAAEYLKQTDGAIDGDNMEGDFADDYNGSFETVGDVYVESDVWGGFSLSTAGATVTDEAIEQFAGLNNALDLNMGIADGKSFNGSTIKKKVNATEGSAIKLSASATAGDIASFYYYFESNDYVPYADFSFYSVGDKAFMIAGVGTNVADYGEKEGIINYTIKDSDIKNGEFSMTVGVVDAKDTAVESVIDVWGFNIFSTSQGEEAPKYEAPDGLDGDDYKNDLNYDYSKGLSVYDLNSDKKIDEKDLILDFNSDGVINYKDIIKQTANGNGSNVDTKFDKTDVLFDKDTNGANKDTYTLATALDADKGTVSLIPGEGAPTKNKGFLADYNSDILDIVYDAKFSGTQFNKTGSSDKEYNFGYLTIDNAANVFGEAVGKEISADVQKLFLAVGEDDFFDDKDGDGQEDGYWEDEYDFEEDSKYVNEKPNQNEDDYYESIDIEYIGNAFQQGDTVVMSTGGGAIDQWDIEEALGLKDGALDQALEGGSYGSKKAIDATHGSAAYDTVEVKAGDVISFGYTFGTNDYVPYQDFAFFAINGKASTIASVGDDVDSYGEVSDVFNYVITTDDLGGDKTGIVKIGVGIVDAIDYCVDSFIEVYDFEISGDEKYLDSGNDGIVEGESAYTISTAVGGSIGAFNVASTPTVKLSLKGKSITAETSAVYDVVASAASTKVSGGYQVLLEGTGKKDGQWFVHQTDAFGAIKKAKKSGWKSTKKAVQLGWEQLFNIDINNDSVLSGTSDADTFTLYSAKTGGVALSLTQSEFDGAGEVLDALDLFTTDNKSTVTTPFIDDNDKVLDLNGDGVITIADALVDKTGDGKLTVDDAASNKFTQAVQTTNALDKADGSKTKAVFVTAADTEVLAALGKGVQQIDKDGKLVDTPTKAVDTNKAIGTGYEWVNSTTTNLYSDNKNKAKSDEITNTSAVKQSDVNLIAATASQANFTTFSAAAETLQVLVAGDGANAGKYQVWTTTAEGEVYMKEGFTYWGKIKAGELNAGKWAKLDSNGKAYDPNGPDKFNNWFTVDQAVTSGLETTFSTDLDGNGVLYGGDLDEDGFDDKSYKILGPTGPLTVKNKKGIALETATADFEIVSATSIKSGVNKGGFELVLKGNAGSTIADKYSIWEANSFGKITKDADWTAKADFFTDSVESKFGFDINGDGVTGLNVGIFDAGGGLTLNKGDKNVAQVTDGGKTYNLKNKKGKSYKIVHPAFSVNAVKSVDTDGDAKTAEVNQALMLNKSKKTGFIISFDDEWAYVSQSAKFKVGSDAFYQAEIDFDLDINGDGIKAVATGNKDNPYLSEVLVDGFENSGDANNEIALFKSDKGVVSIKTDLDSNGTTDNTYVVKNAKDKFIKFKTGPFTMSDIGIFDTNDADTDYNYAKIIATTKKGGAMKVYKFELDDKTALPVLKETKVFKAGSDDFYANEVEFDKDFNGDSIVGKTAKKDLTTIGAGLKAITAQYDVSKKAFIKDNANKSFELFTKNGKSQLKSTIGKFELVAAGEIGSDFEVVYKHSKNNALKVFKMEDVLDTDGKTPTGQKKVTSLTNLKNSSKSILDYLAKETAFGIDFNGDDVIGKDKNNGGAFDDGDLTKVEEEGSLGSYTDVTGAIYAKDLVGSDDAIDTPVKYKGKALTTNTFGKGWTFMGLDNTTLENEDILNAAIFKKSNGKNVFKYIELGVGTDFDYVKGKDSNDILKTLGNKKLVSGLYEGIFNQDLNNDAEVSSF